MGINSLTHQDDGSKVAVPVSHDDWQQWVSAGRTRNWMLDDPLIDWLQLYGKSRDYLTDDANMMIEIRPAELEPGFGEEESVGRWTGAKKRAASELKELTQLWQVGVRKRKEAHAAGIYQWDDPEVTPAAVGVTGLQFSLCESKKPGANGTRHPVWSSTWTSSFAAT